MSQGSGNVQEYILVIKFLLCAFLKDIKYTLYIKQTKTSKSPRKSKRQEHLCFVVVLRPSTLPEHLF